MGEYLFKKEKNKIFWGFCMLLCTAVLGEGITLKNNIEQVLYSKSMEWGVSFTDPGTQPRGNMSAEELMQYNAYYVGSASDSFIYLTFDAGYENGYTSLILDILKEENVPATFFLNASYLEKNTEIISRMLSEGHMIGNHTVHHQDMSLVESTSFCEELQEWEQIYFNITQKNPNLYYRPPEGRFSRQNLLDAQSMGYSTIFWSLAYVDWEDQPSDPDAVLQKLMQRMHPGAIILLHTKSFTNCAILQSFIRECKQAGYLFLPLSQLVTER